MQESWSFFDGLQLAIRGMQAFCIKSVSQILHTGFQELALAPIDKLQESATFGTLCPVRHSHQDIMDHSFPPSC